MFGIKVALAKAFHVIPTSVIFGKGQGHFKVKTYLANLPLPISFER